MHRQHVLGCAIILGTLLVLSLVVVGVAHHPASVQGFGIGLLRMDVALLLVYGIAGVVVWKQRVSAANAATASVGAQVGLLLGAVQISNHLIEAFVPIRPFVLIISPVLLMLALLGMAGALAWGTHQLDGVGGNRRSLVCDCRDANHARVCYLLQHVLCGTCGLAVARCLCRERHDRSRWLPG